MASKKSNFWDSISSTVRYSSYWLSNNRDTSYKSIFDDSKQSGSKHDIYRLAEAREAISNFVRILTQRDNIKVKFKSSNLNENYTDGESIVISPNLDGEEFDVAVGLALHEASHIVNTDFTLLANHVKPTNVRSSYYSICEGKGVNSEYYKHVWNCIEDFYIDAVTYKTAPGYRGYYQALYNKYFGSSDIEKGLNSLEFNTPSWNSYLFHLTNIRNPKRNLIALKELELIWDMLDLKNISRLATPQDRFDLAFSIYGIIERNIPKEQQQSQSNDSDDSEADGSNGGDRGDGENGEQDFELADMGMDMEMGDGDGESNSGEGETNSSESFVPKQLSPTVLKRIENLFKKQQQYLDGKVQKSKVTKNDADSINALEKMDASIRTVCKQTETSSPQDFVSLSGIRVLVIKNVTVPLINAGHMGQYGMYKSGGGYNSYLHTKNVEYVESGISRGKMLANKLQIRNEERVTKSTRLESGTIDRRLLNELGFDNHRVFSKLNIVTFKPVHIHVSIDQSSSMSGDRFFKSLELASALATASLRIKNLHVVVTVRGMSRTLPYICYLFDSKKHNLNQIRNIFPLVHAHGTTPEGLTFEAIEKEIKRDASFNESYFVNICDGQPACTVRNGSVWTEYGGSKANAHCRKQMKKMESNGVKFIAYLLVDDTEWSGHYNSTLKHIQDCYGSNVVVLRGAHEMDKIAKSFNQKLLEVF